MLLWGWTPSSISPKCLNRLGVHFVFSECRSKGRSVLNWFCDGSKLSYKSVHLLNSEADTLVSSLKIIGEPLRFSIIGTVS